MAWHRYLKYKGLRLDPGGPFYVRRVVFASIAYVIANTYDIILTLKGLADSNMLELNSLVGGYMNLFGRVPGLIVVKSALGLSIILGVALLDLTANRSSWYCKASNFLFIGSIIMILGSSLWLLKGPINIF